MALKGLQTADQVVNSVLLRIGDVELNRYQEAVDYFIDIYRDLELFSIDNTKDVILDISTLGVVSLPSDYVDYEKIGVNIKGEWFTFTKRPTIIRLDTDDLEETAESELGEGEDLPTSLCSSTPMLNDKGYFDIDLANDRILLRNIESDRTQIIMRYTSTGIEDMETTYIPPTAINFIKAEMEYALELRNKDIQMGIKAAMKDKCNEERAKLTTLSLPNFDELADAIYETSSRGAR